MTVPSEARPTPAERAATSLWAVFCVPFRRRTYRNLAYLALQFPLGVGYFFVLIPLLAFGVGLSFVLVGVPILVGTLVLVTGLVRLEVLLAETLLDVAVESRTAALDTSNGFLVYAKELILDTGTYVSLAFLLTKFFLGIVTVTLLTFVTALTGGLLAAPLLYTRPGAYRVLADTTLTFDSGIPLVQDLLSLSFAPVVTLSGWTVDTLGESLVVAMFGVVVLLVSLHVLNALTRGLEYLTTQVLRYARTLEG